jgi:hypothetical protein
MRVKAVLQPSAVKASLEEFVSESTSFVKQVMERTGTKDVRDLSLAMTARSQLGRPITTSTPTEYSLTKPLLGVDTKSEKDGHDIKEGMIDNATAFDPVAQAMAGSMHTFPKAMRDALSETCATAMRPCAILARSDGQGSILIANGRSRNEEDWKQFIPCNGDWHTTGHFLFCGNEAYHDSKYGLTKSLLQKEKVAKHIKDFTGDSYRQASQHILADQVGTLHYLLTMVKDPPPELLLDDPAAHEARLQSGGGIAAYNSMKYVGIPFCHWILAARSEDGDKVTKLRAFTFHACRAWAHKPVEVKICLLALLSTEATHPKISEIVSATGFMNWLGHDGSSQYVDVAMERVNLVQAERRASYACFDSSFEFTVHMPAMLHVLAAMDAADELGMGGASSDPMSQALLNAAGAICDDLYERLGDDLTIDDDTNPLYHTGGRPAQR